MSGHCPQDGGFIGDAGCTHPNHQHSELVKGLLEAKEPREISSAECDAALNEGFYVNNPDGVRVGFGKRLLDHINEHPGNDAEGRKTRLLYAKDTVTAPDRVEKAHKGLEGRTAYLKSFGKFGIVALSDKDGKNLESIFTIIPKRKLKNGLPHQSKP